MPGFVLQAAPAPADLGLPAIRVGFTVSRKVGNAVARNRVRRRTLRLVPLESEPAAAAEAAPSAERQALSRAALRELANLVSGLPEHHRAAVVLRCVQGMSYAEVAALLGQPEGTVKAHVHRGLQALRRKAGSLSEVS